MKRRRTSLLAWMLFGVITAATVFTLARDLTNRPSDDSLLGLARDLLWGLLPVVFAILATLIVAHQPRNAIGWLMMIPAALIVIDVPVQSKLQQFPVAPAEPTLGLWLAVAFENFAWLALIFPIFFTMLLFPDGRPPSPRWRFIPVFGLGMCAFLILFFSFSPTLTLLNNENWQTANPIGLLPPDVEFPDVLWFLSLAVLTLLCFAAPFVRYRREAGMKREQIKWLFYACGLFVLVYVPGLLIPDDTFDLIFEGWDVLFVLALMAIPIAIAIAITRHRLYDIDLIIRKTLVYGLLTGLLALVYFGIVLLSQNVFTAVSGQSSPLSLVISTLLIAALFNPLRSRVKALIDRRFYRRKYNATQTLSAFAETARDEVDLEALTTALLKAVGDTMQPVRATVWLKRTERS